MFPHPVTWRTRAPGLGYDSRRVRVVYLTAHRDVRYKVHFCCTFCASQASQIPFRELYMLVNAVIYVRLFHTMAQSRPTCSAGCAQRGGGVDSPEAVAFENVLVSKNGTCIFDNLPRF